MNKNKKDNFFKVVYTIIFKKLPENEGEMKYTTMAFSLLTSIMFFVIGYSLLLLTALFLIYLVYYVVFVVKLVFSFFNIVKAIWMISLIFVCFVISVLMIGAAKEQKMIKRDYDKTISLFSALVSFVALIISFIALIHQ